MRGEAEFVAIVIVVGATLALSLAAVALMIGMSMPTQEEFKAVQPAHIYIYPDKVLIKVEFKNVGSSVVIVGFATNAGDAFGYDELSTMLVDYEPKDIRLTNIGIYIPGNTEGYLVFQLPPESAEKYVPQEHYIVQLYTDTSKVYVYDAIAIKAP